MNSDLHPNSGAPGGVSPRAAGALGLPDRPAHSIERIVGDLRRLRRSARVMLLVRGTAWIAAGVLAIALIAGLIDFVVRWPRELRVALWTVTLLAILVAAVRAMLAAWRFAPNLTEIALRLERSIPGLAGLLAGGVDMADRAASDPMARAVVDDAARATAGVRVSSILRRRPAYAAVGALACVMLVLMLVAAVTPTMAGIGARRVFTPWTRAEWPKRTEVADATAVRVHPMGSALALRAALVRSDRPAGDTRVAGVYRVLRGDRPLGAERRVLLTSQDRPVDPADASAGTLFERLIEPAALAVTDPTGARGVDRDGAGGDAGAPTELTLEYWFETSDDRTEPSRTLLVVPPEVVGAELTVTPPAYALGGAPDVDGSVQPAKLQLGAGNDDRAIPAPSLAGSRIDLTIRFNKPVIAPAQHVLGGEEPSAWLRQALGADAADAVAAIAASDSGSHDPTLGFSSADAGRAWRLRLRLDRTLRVAVQAVDEHAIETVERSTYILESLADAPPSAAITLPTEDRSVLPTARVEVEAEARDDVGLESVALERQIARRPTGSAGAAPEPIEPRSIVSSGAPAPGEGDTESSSSLRLTVRQTLDLSELDLQPGDELWLTGLAIDTFALDGVRHEPVRSAVRKFRIMSRQELVEQVWTELEGVRRSAIQLDEDQRRAMEQLSQPTASARAQAARAQAGIGERLARQDQAIDRLQQRLQENGLSEESLERVLSESRNAVRRAGQRSSQAATQASESAEAAERAQQAEGENQSDARSSSESERAAAQARAEQARKSAQESQQGVRDELANLVDMLDQGQDTWASRRAIERLLEQQREMADRTAALGEQTGGKDPSSLSNDQKRQLAEAAAEQRSLAEQAREAVEQMLERQGQLERNDPAAAEGLAKAAERAQREGVTDRLQEAASQIQQNQTGNAGRQQAAAAAALEQMLQDLDRSAQNRDAVLRRALASLIESLRTLVNVQSSELAALVGVMDDEQAFVGAAPQLGGAMTRLHRNTLGVMDEASSGPREAQAIGRLIERAARNQQNAIVALTDRPPSADESRDQEEASLRALQEALELAQRTDEQAQDREEARAKGELRKAYAQTLERQITLRDVAADLVGKEPTRRTRNSARLLGQDQEALRADLDDIRKKTQELRDARVFDFAHQRLDDLMGRAASSLLEGQATADVQRRQNSSARVLQSLLDALDESKKKKDPFRENEQAQPSGGGQGSGQGGGLFPPAAELKLLRSLQEEALAQTRVLEESGIAADDPAAVEEVAKLQRDLAAEARNLLERVSRGAPAGIEQGGKPDDGGGGGGGAPPGGAQ